MSITRVQANSVAAHSTTATITLPTGVVQGNMLVVAIMIGTSGVAITPPDGSWVQDVLDDESAGANTMRVAIYRLPIDAAHAGQTSWLWTIASSHSLILWTAEWHATNGWLASPVDKTAHTDSGSGTGTSVQRRTTATTTQAGEFCIAALGYHGGLQT